MLMELTKVVRSPGETFGEYVARIRNAEGRSRKYIAQRAQRAGHEISESYIKKKVPRLFCWGRPFTQR